MKITITFANTFSDMMRAKLRWFFGRSLYRYLFATSLITAGLHGADSTLSVADKVTRGILYYVVLCTGVLVLHIVAAAVQSHRITPRTITFTEKELFVHHDGESATRDWDWIIGAAESPTMIVLLIQKMPRLELYLPKTKLNKTEYQVLSEWLVARGKLHRKGTVA